MLDDIDKVESVIVRGSLSGLPEQRAWERIKKTLELAQLSHNNKRVICPAWSDEPISACRIGFGGMCNDRCWLYRAQSPVL